MKTVVVRQLGMEAGGQQMALAAQQTGQPEPQGILPPDVLLPVNDQTAAEILCLPAQLFKRAHGLLMIRRRSRRRPKSSVTQSRVPPKITTVAALFRIAAAPS